MSASIEIGKWRSSSSVNRRRWAICVAALTLVASLPNGRDGVTAAQLLTRPDKTWILGLYQVDFDTCFGLTELDFSGPRVSVESLDSMSFFAFTWANVSYVTPDFELTGNGCALVRDRRDTVESHLDLAEDDARHWVCDPTQTTGAEGHQFLLPLGADTLVYLSELRRRAAAPQLFALTPGYGVSYLDTRALAAGRDVSGRAAVRRAFRVQMADTLLEETADHVSDGRGGWWGVAKSAYSNRFQVWRVTPDTVALLPLQAVGPRRRRLRRLRHG